MPFLVKVADGDNPRALAENLSDDDARDLARRVHAATGDIVTLVPYLFSKGQYVLDEDGAQLFGAPEPEAEEPKAAAKKAPKKAAKKAKA